ncbi:MAG: penicillin-binding transpeptidase domain-containing protein [Firmicutes bacterium]|nr:penicillin-binding transpeptidase domain-containing protein [Bacillota bacterium]
MKIGAVIRSIFLVVITFALVFLAAIQLMKIQIVDGAYYSSITENYLEANQSIAAARGQIADSSGNLLVSNKSIYKVIVQRAFLPSGGENDVIAGTIEILEKNKEKWIDNIPISSSYPFSFIDTDEEELDRFKQNIKLNVDATVADCVMALAERYGIDTEKYDSRTVRLIAGVRYEMEHKDFSYYNRYVFAEDISVETVMKLKEHGFLLSGIDIVQEPKLVYLRGDIAPHVIGTIGSITQSEYDATKDADGNTDYSINDLIGKTGLEYGMESTLKGTDGVRTIVRNSKGEVISDTITDPVQPGQSIKLTIDSDFQSDLQTILENEINWLHTLPEPQRGHDCDAGAVVVLNAKTGAVLGIASYPTFDLLDYVKDPAAVVNDENSSMYNLATQGLFRPGSAFKTINATAGLCEGFITHDTPGICTEKYTYYDDYQPTCTGRHYGYNVVDSLWVSCNIFFYDLARRMGIDTLSSYAEKFGYGTDLGLEIPCASGQMTTVESYELSTGQPWDVGQVLQAGIGQSATQVTPLNLAVQAMTLANNGTRYKPYLVDSIWNYDYTEMISKTEPVIVEQIDDKGSEAFETVREGMIKVSTWAYWPTGDSTKFTFDYLPDDVAIKTGTAELDGIGKYYTSTVMGYYPAHDPQIAFGIILNKADYSRYTIRNIIDAFFYDCYEPDVDEEGNFLSPWKRWTEVKAPVREIAEDGTIVEK